MFGTRGVLEGTSPAGKEQPELFGLTNTTAQPRGSTSGRELSRDRPTLEDTLSLVPGPHSYSAAHLHKWELEITSRRRTRTARRLFTLSCVTPWLTEHKPWIFCKQCQHSSAIVRRVIRALQFDLPLNAHMLPPAELPIPCRNSHESRHTGSSREPGAQQQTQLVLADHGAGWNGLEGSAKELTWAK